MFAMFFVILIFHSFLVIWFVNFKSNLIDLTNDLLVNPIRMFGCVNMQQACFLDNSIENLLNQVLHWRQKILKTWNSLRKI